MSAHCLNNGRKRSLNTFPVCSCCHAKDVRLVPCLAWTSFPRRCTPSSRPVSSSRLAPCIHVCPRGACVENVPTVGTNHRTRQHHPQDSRVGDSTDYIACPTRGPRGSRRMYRGRWQSFTIWQSAATCTAGLHVNFVTLETRSSVCNFICCHAQNTVWHVAADRAFLFNNCNTFSCARMWARHSAGHFPHGVPTRPPCR